MNVSLYGLDPLFRSYRKMLVASLLCCERIQQDDLLLFYHHKRPILRVEVVGVVTMMSFKLKRVVFTICDGTGVMRCEHFRFKDFNISSYRAMEVGSLVTVRGMLAYLELDDNSTNFVVNVKALKLEPDPDVESYHWTRAMLLDRAYQEPIVLQHAAKKLADINTDVILSAPCGTFDNIKRSLRYCRCLASFCAQDLTGALRDEIIACVLDHKIPIENIRVHPEIRKLVADAIINDAAKQHDAALSSHSSVFRMCPQASNTKASISVEAVNAMAGNVVNALMKDGVINAITRLGTS